MTLHDAVQRSLQRPTFENARQASGSRNSCRADCWARSGQAPTIAAEQMKAVAAGLRGHGHDRRRQQPLLAALFLFRRLQRASPPLETRIRFVPASPPAGSAECATPLASPTANVRPTRRSCRRYSDSLHSQHVRENGSNYFLRWRLRRPGSRSDSSARNCSGAGNARRFTLPLAGQRHRIQQHKGRRNHVFRKFAADATGAVVESACPQPAAAADYWRRSPTAERTSALAWEIASTA